MNDLPQDELFSAYLDGELTAAEQAGVERLLATNPAARQLLDELRALSATLQSLPQQKVGEDLSQPVLRVAERRMLTGEDSGPTEPLAEPAVPLVRSIFRRFLRPRTLMWLGLTAAVAIVITINDWSHRAQRSTCANNLVAIGPGLTDLKTEPRGSIQPSMQAAPESATSPLAVEIFKEPDSPSAAKSAESPPVPASGGNQLTDKFAEEPAAKDHFSAGVRLKGSPTAEGDVASAPAAATPAGAPAAPSAKLAFSKKAAAKGGEVAQDKKAGSDRSETSFGFRGAVRAKQYDGRTDEAPADRAVQGQKSGQPGENMLVVHCDISPEAAEKGAFDKLLDANGIAWQDGHDRLGVSDKVQVAGQKTKQADDTQAIKKPADAAGEAAGQVDLVYVEATPAQVQATLAGLSAQPKSFLSVSIEPEQNKPEQNKPASGPNWQELVRQQVRNYEPESKPAAVHREYMSLARSSAKQPVEKAQGAVEVDSIKALDKSPVVPSMPTQGRAQRIQQSGIQVKNEKQNSFGAAGQESPAASLATKLSQADSGATRSQRQLQPESLARRQTNSPAPTQAQQQVLFVLRVVGGEQSGSQAVKTESGVESDAAQPAKSAAPLPAKPADKNDR